jgi:hypothetical protein
MFNLYFTASEMSIITLNKLQTEIYTVYFLIVAGQCHAPGETTFQPWPVLGETVGSYSLVLNTNLNSDSRNAGRKLAEK